MRRNQNRSSSVTHQKAFTIEIGRRADMDVLLTFDCHPAEKRVLYDRDGSGYPGCEAHVEIVGVRVMAYCDGEIVMLRADRPDWFVMLDRIAKRHVDANSEEFIESLCDSLGDEG
jgi:hypothetical protein